MKPLIDYTRHQEKSVKVRIFESDKARLDELQKRLTVETNGTPLSHAQVIRYLLDRSEGK